MDLAKKLPDALAKDKGSNNYKLLSIFSDDREEMRNDFLKINLWRDENFAQGKTLDLIAAQYEQKRGSLTDDQLRFLIRTAKQKNVASGDINSVLTSLCMIFGCDYSDLWLHDAIKPATVKVERLPLSVLVNAGFSTKQATEIIKTVVAIGVNVETGIFEGTFEFSDGLEIDYDKGFADDARTYGGTLSALVGDDEGVPLPI